LPAALVPGLNPALDGICRKATAKAPTDRYPSMKAFAAALMDYLRSTPAPAGAGNLVSTAVDKAAVFQAATVAPGRLPASKAAIFQTPTVAPGPLGAATPLPRVVKKTPVATDSSWPAPKPSRKRWRVVVAGVAAVLIAIFGLALAGRLNQKNKSWQPGPEEFAKLKVGMNLKEMQGILGGGQLAIANDTPAGDPQYAESWRGGWKRVIGEGRVQIWDHPGVLAAFTGDPSGDSKVDVLLRPRRDIIAGHHEQRPADKWAVCKDSFLKLKVGMTLKELEDIIGIGKPASNIFAAHGYPIHSEGVTEEEARRDYYNYWKKAIKEYRVYLWEVDSERYVFPSKGESILAGFSAPPSAASDAKVEALSYRDGIWDEDKGILSGTTKEVQPKTARMAEDSMIRQIKLCVCPEEHFG
jgi:hypothetical protein